MRKVRGVIAVLVALVLAAMAAYGVHDYLGDIRSRPAETEPAPVAKDAPPPPPPPKTLAQRIEPGMRAVTLALDAVSGLSRELTPGDRVDVMAVTPIPGMPEGRISHLLMTGVRVMNVASTEASGGRGSRGGTATLKVTPRDAAALATADPAAKIRLILRNPEDISGDTGSGNEGADGVDSAATAFAPNGGVQKYAAQDRDLNTLIAPGLRAITLTVAPTDGVGGVFRPGDRVDVIVTCPWGNISLAGEDKPGETGVLKETHRNARIMLQNIRVIATDRSLTWDNDLNQAVGQVTLEVSPEDAERLTVLADSKQDKSIIRLIGRNQEDRAKVSTKGAELLDLLSDRRPFMRVEIIRGSLRRDQTFYQ